MPWLLLALAAAHDQIKTLEWRLDEVLDENTDMAERLADIDEEIEELDRQAAAVAAANWLQFVLEGLDSPAAAREYFDTREERAVRAAFHRGIDEGLRQAKAQRAAEQSMTPSLFDGLLD